MRIRCLAPVALLIVGLACVLYAILHDASPGGRDATARRTDADGASDELHGPRLGGGAPLSATTARTPEPQDDPDSDLPRRTGRQSGPKHARSALDLRVVAPVWHAPPEVLLMAVVANDLWVHSAEVRPDEDGWARIDLPARRGGGAALLILEASGYAWLTIRDVRLGVGEVRYYGDVLLDPGRTISGHVVDGDGRGVAGVSVEAYPQGVLPGRIGFVYPRPPESRSGQAGAFEIQHAPREPTVLRARHAMYVVRPQTVPAPTGPVHLRAHLAGHIWGSIGREGGGGAMVMLRAEPLDLQCAGSLIDGSDSYGRIRMGPLLPGRYRVVMEMGHRPGEPPGPDSPPVPSESIPHVEMGIVTVEAGKYASVNWTLP